MFPTIYLNKGNNNYTYYTSNIYPLYYSENLTSDIIVSGGYMYVPPRDNLAADIGISTGTLRSLLITVGNRPVENLTADIGISTGTLRSLLITYSNYPKENLTTDIVITGGTLS